MADTAPTRSKPAFRVRRPRFVGARVALVVLLDVLENVAERRLLRDDKLEQVFGLDDVDENRLELPQVRANLLQKKSASVCVCTRVCERPMASVATPPPRRYGKTD